MTVSGQRHLAGALLILALLTACAVSPAGAEQPAKLSAGEEAYLLWRKGYLLHLLGQYSQAVPFFRKSIEIHPTAEAHTFLGLSLSELGRLDEAIAECQKAIALDPDYGNPYNDIGAYLLELGRPDEAIPWLEKAIAARRYCCYQFAHFNLGRALLMKGRLGDARRSFERALAYDPDYLPALKALEFLREEGIEEL